MSVNQFQNGRGVAKASGEAFVILIPVILLAMGLLVFGFRSGYSELWYDLYGGEAIGTIRPTGEVGAFASLGGYQYVVDGKTYSGEQQKLLREQPTIQYLSTDPSTNRIKTPGVSAMTWVFAVVSVFGGCFLGLIAGVQIYVFFRLRKD